MILKSLSDPAGILDSKTSRSDCGTRNTVQASPSIHPLSREQRFPSLRQQNSLFPKLLEYPNKATYTNQTSHYQRRPPAIVEYPHLQFLFSFGVAPSSREKCRPTSLIMLINHFQIIENETHLSLKPWRLRTCLGFPLLRTDKRAGNATSEQQVHLFHPHPNPLQKGIHIPPRKPTIRKLQPPLPLLTRSLNSTMQRPTPLREPVPNTRPILPQFIS